MEKAPAKFQYVYFERGKKLPKGYTLCIISDMINVLLVVDIDHRPKIHTS